MDLFFVLSGYLLGGILIDVRGTTGNYYKTFYARRAVRILPLYAIFLVAAAILDGVDFKTLLSCLSFTQNGVWSVGGHWGPGGLGVSWSLAVEEQFYLFLPLLVRVVSPADLPKVAITCIIAAPWLRLLSVIWLGNSFGAYMLLPCRMDALFAGVLSLTSCAFRPRQSDWCGRG